MAFSDGASRRYHTGGSLPTVRNKMGARMDGDYPLIVPGTYALKYKGWETRRIFNTVKVFVLFQVADFGEALGVEVARHYNAQRLKGKAGKRGGFVAGKCSDLAREIFTVLEKAGHQTHGMRLDRIPLHLLESHTITGKVSTVKHNSRREPIPESLHYSVIEKLTGIIQT